MQARIEPALTMPTSSQGTRLHVLVLNASPTHRALFAAALSGREGIESDEFHEPRANETADGIPQVVLVDIENETTALNADELLREALNAYPNAATVLFSDKPSSPVIKDLMRRHPLNGCVISTQKVDSVASALILASEGMAVLPTELLDQLRRGKATGGPLPKMGRRGSVTPC